MQLVNAVIIRNHQGILAALRGSGRVNYRGDIGCSRDTQSVRLFNSHRSTSMEIYATHT